MKTTNSISKALAITITAYCLTIGPASAQSKAPQMSIEALYASYIRSDQNAIDMPEYDKTLKISAVKIESSEAFGGSGLILSAGSVKGGPTLARLVGFDQAESSKIASLMPGKAFKAICTVAFNMNSGYVSLNKCVFS